MIEQVEQQDFARQGERKKMKAVLHLRGIKKPVIVNKTNALTLAAAFGKDFDGWIDQHVTIKAEPTTFAGKPTKGIRLYSANGEDAPTLKGPKSKKTSSNEDLNDEIDI